MIVPNSKDTLELPLELPRSSSLYHLSVVSQACTTTPWLTYSCGWNSGFVHSGKPPKEPHSSRAYLLYLIEGTPIYSRKQRNQLNSVYTQLYLNEKETE